MIRPWQKPGARAAYVFVLAVAGTAAYAAFLHRIVPLGDWLVWRIALLWGLCCFLAAACLSAGYRIVGACVSVARLRTPEALVLSAAAGLVAFVLSMYAAGALRLFGPVLALVLPALLLLSGARPLTSFVRQRLARQPVVAPSEARWVGAAAWAFGAFGAFWVYAGAMTPEAINFDASWSHLTIAADYARAGRIVSFDADYTRCFPHLASVVATWSMTVPSWLVGGELPLRWMLALHVELALFLGTLLGVRAVVEWLLDESDAPVAWAGFFLVPAIFVYDKNLGGAADHVLAFFAAPLFLAAMRACPRAGPGSYALAGAFGGAALLTKYQAVYLLAGVFAVFAGLVAWRVLRPAARGEDGGDAGGRAAAEGRGLLVLAGAFAMVASPIFIENAVFHHNPVYPFLIDAFPSRPIVPRAGALFEWLFKDDRYRPKGTLFHRVATSARLMLSWPFEPHYSFTHGVPDGAALFPLALPMVLALRAPRRIALGYAACLVALFAWAMTFRVDRHLQTFMPLIAATMTAVLIRAWQLGRLARVGVLLLVILQVAWSSDAPFASGRARIESALDLVASSYAGSAVARFQGFRARERAIASALPADALVLLHTYRPSLGIERDVLLDWAGQQGLISYDDVRDPASLYALYRSLGVTHLLWLPGQRPAPSKQEDVLFTDLVARYGQAVERFSDEVLLPLPAPADAPVPQAPYFVLSLGLPGYHDGLYPVESMRAQEAVPDHREPFASPAVPWPDDATGQVALLLRANAACVGVHAAVPPGVREVLRAFQNAETYKAEFAIYVRRPPSTP